MNEQAPSKENASHLPSELRRFAKGCESGYWTGVFIEAAQAIEAAAQSVLEPRADLIADAIKEIDAFCDRTNTAWPTLTALRVRLADAYPPPRPAQPPEAWRSALIDKPTEADGPVVLVFTGEAYSVEYPGDVNGVEHIAWHRITPYTRPTKGEG